MQRGTFTDFCGEVGGSSKEYAFRLSKVPLDQVKRLSVSEGAVDALSQATMELENIPELYATTCYQSLGGNDEAALERFLEDYGSRAVTLATRHVKYWWKKSRSPTCLRARSFWKQT